MDELELLLLTVNVKMETVGSTKISATETQGMKFYYKGNLL